MIREHAFNSKWWGTPIGVVEDPALFDLDPVAQQELCAPFTWVEFATDLAAAPSGEKLMRAGFFLADIQVQFRINLAKVETTPSIEKLCVESAKDLKFNIDASQLKRFEHERFLQLPEGSPERICDRYAIWSNQLIKSHPESCLEISNDAGVQGWFLAERHSLNTVRLTLAMLKSKASISGHLLYHKALIEFARRGSRIGEASFSVTNTAVMNIYSNLGARFLSPRGHWLWVGGVDARRDG